MISDLSTLYKRPFLLMLKRLMAFSTILY